MSARQDCSVGIYSIAGKMDSSILSEGRLGLRESYVWFTFSLLLLPF
jgi:hypothetical protein